MGYEAIFDYYLNNATVDPQKIKKLNKMLKNPEDQELYGFYNAKVILNKKNKITKIRVEEYLYKFYDHEYFAKKLSECIIEGNVNLIFYGDVGEPWGWKVSKNKVEEIYPIWMTKDEYEEYRMYKQLQNSCLV